MSDHLTFRGGLVPCNCQGEVHKNIGKSMEQHKGEQRINDSLLGTPSVDHKVLGKAIGTR